MFQFHKPYFALTVVFLITEILIAIYVHDAIVRPYVGDILVVILIYCFLKSFFRIPVLPTLAFVLVFAFVVELLQSFRFVEKIGLQNSKFANTVLGNSFAWMDVFCYVIGALLVFLAENIRKRFRSPK